MLIMEGNKKWGKRECTASKDHSLMVKLGKRFCSSSSIRLLWHPFTLQNASYIQWYSGRASPVPLQPIARFSYSTQNRFGYPLHPSKLTQAEMRKHLPVSLGESCTTLDTDMIALYIKRKLRNQSSCSLGHCPLIRWVTPSSPSSLKPASSPKYQSLDAWVGARLPSLSPWHPTCLALLILP